MLRAVFIFITGEHNFPFQPVQESTLCPVIIQSVDFRAHKFSMFFVKPEQTSGLPRLYLGKIIALRTQI